MKTGNRKFKNSIFAVVVLCFFALPALAAAQELVVPKGLALVNYGATPNTGKEQLQVSVWMEKETFVPGEFIKFYVKGNQTFFLWLFSIDEKSSRADMIIPGQLQKGNKFTGNRRYSVPSYRNLIAGAPGNKKVVMVTSTRWLKYFDLSKLTVRDGFYSTTSQNMNVMLKELASDKGLALTSSGQNSNSGSSPAANQVIVSTFNFKVLGNSAGTGDVVLGGSARKPASDNVVFVAQNRDSYNLGDAVTIVYGANKPGYVELFLQYPNGKTEFLQKTKVDGKKTYTVNAIAVRPAGPQTLMAVFHPDKKTSFKPSRIQSFIDWVFKGNNQEKGLYISNPNQNVPHEQQIIYDMSRFHIR